MKNVLAYLRVSTDQQATDDKFGLSWQREVITKYCDENDLNIIDWKVDDGYSGATLERPALNEILYATDNPPVEGVVCAKSDRLAREIKSYFYIKQVLCTRSIEVVSVTEDFGEMGVFAPILEAFTMFVAEQERRNIRIRTKGGRDVKARQGGYCGGKTPFGYKSVDGFLEIDEEEAKIVRLAYELRNEGYTLRAIAQEITDRGFTNRSGNPVSFTNIKGILHNEKTYKGYYRYGDNDWVLGQHKPIL